MSNQLVKFFNHVINSNLLELTSNWGCVTTREYHDGDNYVIERIMDSSNGVMIHWDHLQGEEKVEGKDYSDDWTYYEPEPPMYYVHYQGEDHELQ